MSIAIITSKIRNIIQDNSQSTSDIFTYESSDIFKLGDINVVSVDKVFINDVELSASGNWSYDADTNRVTLLSGVVVSAGDIIEIQYTLYSNYSDAELLGFIKNALYQLTVYKYKEFEVDITNDDTNINPEPTTAEENLIAIIAGTIVKPGNISYRLPDLSIQTSSKMSKEEIIQSIIATFKKDSAGLFDTLDNKKFI